MVGNCPRCGSKLVRPEPCDAAVCTCHNPPIIVPLQPEGVRRTSTKFKRKHPLICPNCLKPMRYLSENRWDCDNPKCEVITLHKSEATVRIVKAAVI